MGVGGLDDFDEEEAAQSLAAVGQPLPDVSVELEGPPRVFDAQGNVMPPDVASGFDLPAAQAQVQKELDANPMAFDAHASVTPDQEAQAAGAPTVSAAGPAPAISGQPSVNAAPQMKPPPPSPGQPQDLPPRPTPPILTGDGAKDAQNNILYQRQWHEHVDALNARHAEDRRKAAAGMAEQASAEAKLAREQAAQQAALRKQQAEERAQNQGEIAAAVKEKAAAAGDLDGFKWDKPYTGGQIAAIIAGAFAQGLQNMGAVYAGHAPTAQNEAFKLVNLRMEQDYQQRKDKVARAGDALLQARYGFNDAQDNRRAAQNDLNADYAARWALVKKEAEERARRAAVPEAEIQNLLLIAGAGQKAAEHEGEILQREEGHQIQREQGQATLKLAEANLGVRRTAERDTHMDRVAARQDRAAARGEAAAAKKEKAAEKEDTTAVRDDDGAIIGHVPTGRGGAVGFSTRDADYKKAEEQMQALIDHVKTKGARPFSPKDISDRDTLYNNALGGVVTVSPMGKTNEAQHVEQASIGPSGGFSVRGANVDALERKLHEVRTQRERYRKQTLIPVAGGAAPAKKGDTAAAKREPTTREFLQNLLDESE